jgi:mRNA-degrading endonuclease YafQ of YafQ-DinJ toxin-antitoxin module
MQWKVQSTPDCDKAVKEMLKKGELTREDQVVIRDWYTLVTEQGPEALLKRPDKWNDHLLTGKWAGHRASNFSYTGRIIYRIEASIITVDVVRITPDHNYRS